MNNKNNFSSKIGFILAAAGSAVGLGNIWRFPYLAAKYGGGIFLFIYLILAVTFGFSLMITEIALGRKTGKSVLYAFTDLNKKFSFVGILASIVPILIFPYYCVIGGWVVKYMKEFVMGNLTAAASDTYFSGFISKGGEPVVWLLIFTAATALIVMMGVQKGIEKMSKIMMPILVVLCIIIAVFSLTQDGAIDGLMYYIKPDFGKFSINAVLAAMGQMFYSMSLAMGIMVTYGSYMKKSEDIDSSVRTIEIFDSGIAFLAGMIIIPAVFSFSGGDESVLSSGPSLMFITLPKVFSNMPLGNIVGAVFFILVFLAALTSAISILETIVSIIQDKFHTQRIPTCLGILSVSFIVSVLCSLGFGPLEGVTLLGMSILDFLDFTSNSLLMPVVALFTCIFAGFVIKPETICAEVKSSGSFRREKMYKLFIKYIAPVLIILILISSVLNTFGIIEL